ncbi:hypothetical protein AAH991_21745 [Microbispora sp. ZYX-F-249]|uniref:DUF4190 domain-containing protein n=1 Tax=Microbispora maris TaxID=3144104 RepID=A0ABV0AUA7_9ACTN
MSYQHRPDGSGGLGAHPSGGGRPHPRAGAHGCPSPAPYGCPPSPGRATGGTAIAPLLCALASIIGVISGHVAVDRLARTAREGRGAAPAVL